MNFKKSILVLRKYLKLMCLRIFAANFKSFGDKTIFVRLFLTQSNRFLKFSMRFSRKADFRVGKQKYSQTARPINSKFSQDLLRYIRQRNKKFKIFQNESPLIKVH